MERESAIKDWIPLISKLVWPIFIVILLLVFHKQFQEIYQAALKEGRSLEIAGLLKLGEAAARTGITDLAEKNLSVKAGDLADGANGVTRKGGASQLEQLQRKLRANPSTAINTLLLTEDIHYSVGLLKEYIVTLGLRFVVFQGDKFDGWIPASTFIAQLPESNVNVTYNELLNRIIGINGTTANSNDSVRQVLEKMQEFHVDSLPVVDSDGRWLFFANREEILARLLTTIIFEQER